MKSVFAKLAMAGAMVALTGMATAQTAFEGFESFSGVFAAANNTTNTGFDGVGSATTLPGFTGIAVHENFGGTPISIDTVSPFEGSQALRWAGDSDQYALIRGAAYGTIYDGTAGTPNTVGSVFAAFAVRVNSLDATLGNNDIELFRLGQVAGERDLHIGAFNGVLEIVGRNGAPFTTLSTTAFDAASPSNWTTGGNPWRVLAVKAVFDTAAPNSVVSVWEVPAAGAPTLLGATTPFTATRNSGITHYGIGAFAAVPSGTAAVSFSLDAVRIYNNAAAEVATDSGFLSLVQGDYFSSNVEDWMAF
jgi:hypothetical protein